MRTTLFRLVGTALLLIPLAACADDGLLSSFSVDPYVAGYGDGYDAYDSPLGYGGPFVDPGYPMDFSDIFGDGGWGGGDGGWGDDDD